jgi:hypothetical protein
VRFEGSRTGADRGAERTQWVAEYRASGLGLKQFAHENGMIGSQPRLLGLWVRAGVCGLNREAHLPGNGDSHPRRLVDRFRLERRDRRCFVAVRRTR